MRTVSSNDRPKPSPTPGKTSLRAPVGGNESKVASLFTASAKLAWQQTRAAASPLSLLPALHDDPYNYPWNASNYTTADDPGTERGDVPGHAVDGGSGSGNFQFAAPILGLDGRGLDLNLGANFNSRIWHKSGSEMIFDIDRDWIPGWSLGFGKIVVAGNAYMLIDGDGTRHPYTGTARGSFPSPATSLQTFEGHTTDGSFIDYYAEGYKTQFSGGYILKAWAKLPNGTTIDYGASALGAGKTGAIYPKQITDANGNYITITYRLAWTGTQWTEQGPEIETITDSLGRAIQFHYDSNNLPVAINAPGMRDAQGNWQWRTIVRFQYDWKNLGDAGANYGFSGVTTRVRSSVIPVVRAIYYPATSTGYWFGDADSYSPYGMIRKVSERRAMTCSVGGYACSDPSAPLTEQPTIGAGAMSREMVYNYPQSGSYLSDAPTYTQMTEEWAARDTASAPVTSYSVVDLGATRRTTITRPDGVRVEQDTNDDPNSAFYGLLVEDRTYPDASSQMPIHSSHVDWETGHYNSPRPTRTEVTDERGQLTATNYSYGASYNQVVHKTDLGYGGTTQLHRVYSEYENSAAYTGYLINSGTLWWHQGGLLYGGPQWSGPHISNLTKVTEVYAANDTTRVARTEYEYDQQAAWQLQDTPGVTQHASAPDQRGNLASVKRYADAAGLNQTTAVTETRNYDVCGNVIKLNTACCEQTTFLFTSNTQYAWPEGTTRGSATDATKQNTTSAVYDLNTGLLKEFFDANGRRSNTEYQLSTLRPEWEWAPTNAYGYHIYDDAGLIVYDFAYAMGESGGNFASRSDKYLDGHGRVRGEIAYGKDYLTDGVLTKFDNIGRLWQQSRPYRTTPEMTTYEYDELDRVKNVTAPDGSIVERFYNESSYPSAATQGAPGQTVSARDQWGRERWARFDEQNRLVEVVEPNPDGDGTVAANGLKTSYSHDTLGNLTLVTQGSQTRSFKYDALSRLTNQKLAERDATLNDAGQYVGSGQWSDFFSHDTRSNLVWRVDARGVKTIFNYNSDPLNRLQSVQYDKSGVPGSLVGDIPDAPIVTYSYVTSGDKMRLNNYTVAGGMGSETFGYDSYGRLFQATQTFTGRESYPLLTNYTWDSLDRMQKLTYPMRYGTSDTLRKEAVPTYDIASRLNGLSFDGASFASNPIYNAASQIESLNVGSLKQETYTFDPKTGLLLNQQVKQGAASELFLGYNYTLNNDPNNNGAKTGQLTGVTDYVNFSRGKSYQYDKLGRLKEARGGNDPFNNPTWTQAYSYDRYGNRTGVTKSGPGAGSVPLDGLASLNFTNGQGQTTSNRITTTGYEYDPAGNLTRGQTDNGVWLRYKYDAAGRSREAEYQLVKPLIF